MVQRGILASQDSSYPALPAEGRAARLANRRTARDAAALTAAVPPPARRLPSQRQQQRQGPAQRRQAASAQRHLHTSVLKQEGKVRGPPEAPGGVVVLWALCLWPVSLPPLRLLAAGTISAPAGLAGSQLCSCECCGMLRCTADMLPWLRSTTSSSTTNVAVFWVQACGARANACGAARASSSCSAAPSGFLFSPAVTSPLALPMGAGDPVVWRPWQ